MKRPEPTLTDALRQVIGDEAMDRAERWNANRPYDPTSDLDEASLRRSFGGLSKSGRTEQRHPRGERVVEPWADELATPAELRAGGAA